ncbi:unnamed protein product [Candida verbasci]|uniref:Transcription factor IIIA n=1 Tax=Candida verbasci TaxID=1227364 RepID=A0A9W4XBU1_9ASCO|nr:unnamed protein product [Candida verbasci]
MTSDTSSISSKSSIRPKRYKCTEPGCDKAYNRPSLLEQHLRSHTNERPFKCTWQDCQSSFLRKSHLDTHLISHNDNENKPFHCSVCGKGVNTAQHLKRHEITHTKSFKCTSENCTESFYKHQSLRHHILSTHKKSLTCLKCNKSFTRPSKLEHHNLKFHQDSPQYQCDYSGCFKNFKTWSALQFHIKQDHPKVKCPICNKGCVGKKGLKSHMLVHQKSEENEVAKLWQCNYCDDGKFSKKNELINHYNLYHDRNVPEELLKPSEVEKLDNLLNGGYPELTADELAKKKQGSDDEEDEIRSDVRSDYHTAQKSLNSLNTSMLDDKFDIIKVIQSSTEIKIPCPKSNCNRQFSRNHDLQRHLKWHDENLQKIESFLNDLQEEPPLKKQKV